METTADAPTDVPALLAAARAGDAAALGGLLDRFRDRLKAMVEADLHPAVRGKVPASDVVQDTLLEAFKLFERFGGDRADEFRWWLTSIARNKLKDASKRFLATDKREVDREVPLGGADAADRGPTPSGQAVRQESAAEVRAAVARLDPDYQTVIRLRTYDGRSFADIGRLMGRTEDAARMLFGRAIKRLTEDVTGAQPPRPAG
jgi:RNA polymerase sigma-70 factor (ECF subfamily)